MNDYSTYEKRLAEIRMKGMEFRAEEAELRFNPYHDPQNGRFISGNTTNGRFIGGANAGYLYVGKGQKGNGVYVVSSARFSKPIENKTFNGSVVSEWKDVNNSSPNTIWMKKSNSHALIKTSKGTILPKKRSEGELLDMVNTATVVLPTGVDINNKREVNRLIKKMDDIKSYGFDIPKINLGPFETNLFIKRNLFTKDSE